MFDDLASNERHYALNYYLYLVGWHKTPPAVSILPARAVALRAMAKAEALDWVNRRYDGPHQVIPFKPKGE